MPSPSPSPTPALTIPFEGGPCAGRSVRLTRRPAPYMTVTAAKGVYVLDAARPVYVWHEPAGMHLRDAPTSPLPAVHVVPHAHDPSGSVRRSWRE